MTILDLLPAGTSVPTAVLVAADAAMAGGLAVLAGVVITRVITIVAARRASR